MNARLLISKDLLSENGIIVVTIDDYEVENLTLLMNQIFGGGKSLRNSCYQKQSIRKVNNIWIFDSS